MIQNTIDDLQILESTSGKALSLIVLLYVTQLIVMLIRKKKTYCDVNSKEKLIVTFTVDCSLLPRSKRLLWSVMFMHFVKSIPNLLT